MHRVNVCGGYDSQKSTGLIVFDVTLEYIAVMLRTAKCRPLLGAYDP